MINGRGLMGLGAGGCVSGEVDGECMYGGQSVSCKLIRECDSMTGAQHFEYGTPGGRSGNVNIGVRGNNGEVIGRADERGNFIPVNDPRFGVTPTNTNAASNAQSLLNQASTVASREAMARYPMDATARAIYTAQRIAQLMALNNNSISTGFNQGLLQPTLRVTPPATTTPTFTGSITPTTIPVSTINTNAGGASGTTIPTTTPTAVQATSFSDLVTGKLDAVSEYVKDSDNWLMLGVGGAAVLGLLYMSSGRGRR